MAQKRGDTVISAAQKLLGDMGITKAPINVESIASNLGVLVSYEEYKEDLSGVLVKEKNRVVIGVNSVHPRTRQRFTIAHEIGHLILKHNGEIFLDQTVMKREGRSSQTVELSEIEANRFAAELLMPEALIKEAVQQNQENKKGENTTTQLITELATEFEVSTQAMEYRLTNLGMFIPQ